MLMTANEARQRVEEGKAKVERMLKYNAEGYANSTVSNAIIKATTELKKSCEVEEMETEKENKYLQVYLEKRGYTVCFLTTNKIKIEW